MLYTEPVVPGPAHTLDTAHTGLTLGLELHVVHGLDLAFHAGQGAGPDHGLHVAPCHTGPASGTGSDRASHYLRLWLGPA